MVPMGIVTWRDDATGLYVAHVPLLDVYSQGQTRDEARVAGVDAATLYIKHAEKRAAAADFTITQPDPDHREIAVHVPDVEEENA